jgi:hypothetical protein
MINDGPAAMDAYRARTGTGDYMRVRMILAVAAGMAGASLLVGVGSAATLPESVSGEGGTGTGVVGFNGVAQVWDGDLAAEPWASEPVHVRHIRVAGDRVGNIEVRELALS